jgi:hypothetical protein
MIVLSAPNYDAVAEGADASCGRLTPVLPSPFSDTLAMLMNVHHGLRRAHL